MDTQAKSNEFAKKSANFISSYTAKFHEYIVQVLRTFSANVDNEGLDETAFLEEAMSRQNWSE